MRLSPVFVATAVLFSGVALAAPLQNTVISSLSARDGDDETALSYTIHDHSSLAHRADAKTHKMLDLRKGASLAPLRGLSGGLRGKRQTGRGDDHSRKTVPDHLVSLDSDRYQKLNHKSGKHHKHDQGLQQKGKGGQRHAHEGVQYGDSRQYFRKRAGQLKPKGGQQLTTKVPVATSTCRAPANSASAQRPANARPPAKLAAKVPTLPAKPVAKEPQPSSPPPKPAAKVPRPLNPSRAPATPALDGACPLPARLGHHHRRMLQRRCGGIRFSEPKTVAPNDSHRVVGKDVPTRQPSPGPERLSAVEMSDMMDKYGSAGKSATDYTLLAPGRHEAANDETFGLAA